MVATSQVKVVVEEEIGTITLNDPSRKNPLSIEMKEEILEALDLLNEEKVRCIVIEGAGDAFCAGGDIEQMKESFEGEAGSSDVMDQSHRLSNEIISRIASIRIPVIMKIDGAAAGGGAGLALAGDIRLASDRAKIGFTFRHVGLSIDDATSYHLPEIVGLGKAKELVFKGKTLDANTAQELGLVQQVYPTKEFEERCEEFIEDIATGPTKAIGLMKRLLNRSGEKSLEQALEDELAAQKIALASSDHREGIKAFLESRDSEFVGR